MVRPSFNVDDNTHTFCISSRASRNIVSIASRVDTYRVNAMFTRDTNKNETTNYRSQETEIRLEAHVDSELTDFPIFRKDLQ